jgi:AAA domain-containing protein
MREYTSEEIREEAWEEQKRQHQNGKWRDYRNDHAPKQSALISVCASEVGLEPVEWIWRGRIARGKHTCIAGEPGTGKSQLSTFVASTITMGGTWPCGEGRAPQGSVIILSAEDGAADTIAPRLHATGADLGSVHIIKSVMDGDDRRTFNLQHDLALLEAECNRIGDVVLIVVDPVSSYLGKTDSHKNAEVLHVRIAPRCWGWQGWSGSQDGRRSAGDARHRRSLGNGGEGVSAPRGERNGRAVLTENAVRAIRRSSETCLALGKRYGVSASAIFYARVNDGPAISSRTPRLTWRHVEQPRGRRPKPMQGTQSHPPRGCRRIML